MAQQRLHATISGRVQGVGFRYFVVEEAEKRHLQGWVRNRFNGSVEVLAEGEFDTLENLLQLLRQGPPGSFVNNVDYEWSPARGEFKNFSVRGYA